MIIKVPLAFFININLPELYKPEESPIISLSPKKKPFETEKSWTCTGAGPSVELVA